MSDTSDSYAVVPHLLGDLHNVDTTTVDADGAGSLYKAAAAGAEWVRVAPAVAIADSVAITGGESPTEAEHNALITKQNAILAALRTHGIVTP